MLATYCAVVNEEYPEGNKRFRLGYFDTTAEAHEAIQTYFNEHSDRYTNWKLVLEKIGQFEVRRGVYEDSYAAVYHIDETFSKEYWMAEVSSLHWTKITKAEYESAIKEAEEKRELYAAIRKTLDDDPNTEKFQQKRKLYGLLLGKP